MGDSQFTPSSLEESAFAQLLAAVKPETVDAETFATLIKVANWLVESTEDAAAVVAELLAEHKQDERLVKQVHDLLGELAAMRHGAALIEMLLAKLTVSPEAKLKPAPKMKPSGVSR